MKGYAREVGIEMAENDDDRRSKLVFVKIVVWVVAYNMIKLMLGSSANVTTGPLPWRSFTGPSYVSTTMFPEHTLYVGVLLYVGSAIWEYYDPKEPVFGGDLRAAMAGGLIISCSAMLADTLILPIGFWVICLVGTSIYVNCEWPF